MELERKECKGKGESQEQRLHSPEYKSSLCGAGHAGLCLSFLDSWGIMGRCSTAGPGPSPPASICSPHCGR